MSQSAGSHSKLCSAFSNLLSAKRTVNPQSFNRGLSVLKAIADSPGPVTDTAADKALPRPLPFNNFFSP